MEVIINDARCRKQQPLWGTPGFCAEWLDHEPREVIYTVINMLELGRLKQYLYEIDPDAFMAVNDTAEVIGKKFLSWEDEGFKPIRKKPTAPDPVS